MRNDRTGIVRNSQDWKNIPCYANTQSNIAPTVCEPDIETVCVNQVPDSLEIDEGCPDPGCTIEKSLHGYADTQSNVAPTVCEPDIETVCVNQVPDSLEIDEGCPDPGCTVDEMHMSFGGPIETDDDLWNDINQEINNYSFVYQIELNQNENTESIRQPSAVPGVLNQTAEQSVPDDSSEELQQLVLTSGAVGSQHVENHRPF